MNESSCGPIGTAELRVLQVGYGQITLSMYRQLDEAAFERFEAVGRVWDDKGIPKTPRRGCRS